MLPRLARLFLELIDYTRYVYVLRIHANVFLGFNFNDYR
jgi:hypothetical protein